MTRCRFEDEIEAYLRGSLDPEGEDRFEEHYFNCPSCFRLTAERGALREAFKAGGEKAFPARPRPRPVPGWVYGAAAAASLIAAVLLFLPPPRPKPLPFTFSGDETVRGAGIAVVEPRGSLPAPPGRLAWEPVPSAARYEVVLTSGQETLWTTETKDPEVGLPPDLKARLQEGGVYLWRIRAFAAEGRMLAFSEKTSFTVGR
jgi:hypothetical protein